MLLICAPEPAGPLPSAAFSCSVVEREFRSTGALAGNGQAVNRWVCSQSSSSWVAPAPCFLVNEAARLLAALRLWAQRQHRSDRAVRDILDAVDVSSLENVADELRALGDRDPRAASGTIKATMRLPEQQLRWPSPRTPLRPTARDNVVVGSPRLGAQAAPPPPSDSTRAGAYPAPFT